MQPEDRQRWWDERYRDADPDKLVPDDWVTRRLDPTGAPLRILELGAGIGHLSALLASRGHTVVATDISETAISVRFPKIRSIRLDHTDPLPFTDGTFDLVVADLCLHYFDAGTTSAILFEIERVLANDGTLLARVNSTNDVNHGAGKGVRIEPGFYQCDGHYKRFFDGPMIRRLWRRWRELEVAEQTIYRYHDPKVAYEVSARRPR